MPLAVRLDKGAHLLRSTLGRRDVCVGRSLRDDLGALAWHVACKRKQCERKAIQRRREEQSRHDLDERLRCALEHKQRPYEAQRAKRECACPVVWEPGKLPKATM